MPPAMNAASLPNEPNLSPFTDATRTADGLPWISGTAPRTATPAANMASVNLPEPRSMAPVNAQPMPSAAPLVALSPAPRIRLPGYPPPLTFATQPVRVAQAPTNIGAVQITELPSIQPATATQPTPAVGDGFRARPANRF